MSLLQSSFLEVMDQKIAENLVVTGIRCYGFWIQRKTTNPYTVRAWEGGKSHPTFFPPTRLQCPQHLITVPKGRPITESF